jgi:hypothetical protein
MIAAYGESDAVAARTLTAAVSSITAQTNAERIHALRTKLIYNFEFGDLSLAAEIAEEYLCLAKEAAPNRVAQALRLSTYPHRIIGNWEIVRDRLGESLEIASSRRNPSDVSQALQALAATEVEHLNYAEAVRRSDELLEVGRRCPPAITPPMRLDVSNIASMVGNFALADEQLSQLDGTVFSAHGRCDHLATRVFATAMRGGICDAELVVELISLNERLRGRPGQELGTIGLALGLAQHGRSGEAVTAVANYVHVTRRERYASSHPVTVSFSAANPLVNPNEIRIRAGCSAL